MSTISRRIKYAMDIKGIKQADLVRLTGIGKSSISTYLAGKYDPKQKNIYKIARALNVNEAWLMGYSDDMEKVSNTPALLEVDDEPSITFPIIGEVAAGYDCPAIEEETGEYEQIPASWLHRQPKENFFVLKVKGDSMYPAYRDGDRVLIHRASSVNSGSIAVVLYETEVATLKKVKYVYGEDWLELIPLNPEYAPKRIEGPDLEQCTVLGEVWRLIRVIK